MIPVDFDAELIFQTDATSLFAARKPDVWHFVLATNQDPSNTKTNLILEQFHWPRYSVARALTATTAENLPKVVQQVGMGVNEGQGYVTLRGATYPLPDSIFSELSRDVQILERATTKVKTNQDGFGVSRALTPQRHPVETSQRFLAEAIAFERETRKVLKPKKFGIYSAYCTWRDFPFDDKGAKKDIAAGMVKEMLTWDPASFGDNPYWASVLKIQNDLWGKGLWGPGIDSTEDELLGAFLQTFNRLTSIQAAQFVLMNGMHRSGPFHALAPLLGLIDFNEYKSWITRGLQPDSAEEQEIRIEASFIELLGLDDVEARPIKIKTSLPCKLSRCSAPDSLLHARP